MNQIAIQVNDNSNILIVPQKKESVKLKPTDTLIIPIDNVTRQIFKPTNKKALTNKFEVNEGHGIKTVLRISKEVDLNPLDRLVYSLAISEFRAGNNVLSVRRLWQKMGGSHYLKPNTAELIKNSIDKLESTRFNVDMTAINNARHYTEEKELQFKGRILPCGDTITANINGQMVEGLIELLKEPRLFSDNSSVKKQFATCDINFLDVPTLKNTETTLTIKAFLLFRTIEIVGSGKGKKHFAGRDKNGKIKFRAGKKLKEKILLDSLFKECQITNIDRGKKRDVRTVIAKIMNSFKEKGLIVDWNFEKQNGEFRAIELVN